MSQKKLEESEFPAEFVMRHDGLNQLLKIRALESQAAGARLPLQSGVIRR